MSDTENLNLNDEILNDDVKKTLEEMSFDELLNYTKHMKNKKRQYIRKYQQSDKGKEKVKEASKRHYNKNREKILEKKRLQYQLKKQAN
tara:strand:+ start:100 stop:366 length:267 start_codon:yes stop_codon:yes gene_type:complete